MYNKAAKALGLPVELVRKFMYQYEFKSRDNRKDYKQLNVVERRLARQIEFVFMAQMQRYINRLANITFFNQKGVRELKNLDDDLRIVFEETPEQTKIVELIAASVAISMLLGMKRTRKYHKEVLPYLIDLQNANAVKYLSDLTALHLSQFKGSIRLTTELEIRDIILNGLRNAETYTQIANSIQEQGTAGVFSAARAKTIAIDQSSKAYAYGQKVQMDYYISQTAANVSKFWSTVNDLKVSPTICIPNQNQGWIPWKANFQSGHDMTPGHVNCRCGIITRIN